MDYLTFLAICIIFIPWHVALFMCLFWIKQKIDGFFNVLQCVSTNNIKDKIIDDIIPTVLKIGSYNDIISNNLEIYLNKQLKSVENYIQNIIPIEHDLVY